MKPGYSRDSTRLKMPEPYLPRRELHAGSVPSPGGMEGKSCLSALKPKPKTLNLELWDSVFSLPGSGLSLVQYFFTVPLCLSLQMAVYDLYIIG